MEFFLEEGFLEEGLLLISSLITIFTGSSSALELGEDCLEGEEDEDEDEDLDCLKKSGNSRKDVFL